jgi:DNA sulfur modification protein DndD
VESEIRGLCEKVLPLGIVGKLFQDIRQQIETERESASGDAIKAHAADLAKRIVRVVEEPEPIYHEKLSDEKMYELELRIYRLLKEGDSRADILKIIK